MSWTFPVSHFMHEAKSLPADMLDNPELDCLSSMSDVVSAVAVRTFGKIGCLEARGTWKA